MDTAFYGWLSHLFMCLVTVAARESVDLAIYLQDVDRLQKSYLCNAYFQGLHFITIYGTNRENPFSFSTEYFASTNNKS